MVSPLNETIKPGLTTFSLSSLLCLSNNGVIVQSVSMNFGSLGVLSINPNQTGTINIPNEGILNFIATVTYTNGQQFINKSRIIVSSSGSNNRVAGADPETEPCFSEVVSSTILFQGYDEPQAYKGINTVNYYYRNGVSCNKTKQTINKPIIVVDGFDPTNKRLAEKIRTEAFFFVNQNGNPDNLGTILRAQGYDIIIVNHPDYTEGTRTIQTPNGPQTIDRLIHGGGDYIERNAMVLVKIIQDINAQLPLGSTEKIVIVGPSMGGQISRIALKYMENNNINHNCRLWVSFDSPHKGSVLPIGLQGMAKAFSALFYKADALLRDQINSPAAKQELIHHHLSNSELPAGAPGFFDRYYNYINTLGWPQNLRKIAGNSGAHNGAQQNPGFTCNNALHIHSDAGALTIITDIFGVPTVSDAYVKLSPSKSQVCCNTAYIKMLYKGEELINFTQFAQNNSTIYNQSLEMLPGGFYPGFKEITDSLKSTDQVIFNSKIDEISWKRRKKGKYPDVTKAFDNHTHIPIASALGYGLGPSPNPNRKWDDNVSQLNLAIPCEGEIPFDGYFGPLTFNTLHDSLFNDQALWLLDEINAIPRSFKKQRTVIIQADQNNPLLCAGQTRVFYIPNAPAGMTYTWSTSHAFLEIISGQGTSTVTIKHNGPASYQGSIYSISCQASGDCYIINNITPFDIYVGIQPVQGWYNSPYNPSEPLNPSAPLEFNWNDACFGQYINTNMSVWPGTTVTWQDAGNSGGITWWQNGNNITFYFSDPNAYAYFSVTTTNACGSNTVVYRFRAVSDGDCGGPPLRMSIAPNPANDKTEIFLYESNDKNRKKEIFEIRVLDKLGNVIRKIKYGKGTTSITLDVSELKTDVYLITVFDGIKWTSGKFIKQ